MKHSLFFAIGIITLLTVAGCADVTTTQKVGDFGTAFGTTTEEQQAINWFKATYGDPTTNNGGAPRFIEPLITSGISDKKLPVDKVTVFPASGGSVYFFVIYDNFEKGDPITVTWTYLENNRVVTTVNQQAGGDFGRFIVEFQKPDSGWGTGSQRISVSGGGATADAEFVIGDSLKTVPLPYNPVTTGTTTAQATGTMTIPATTLTTAATVQPTLTQSCFDQGKMECNGACVDIYYNDANCGGCGMDCAESRGFGSHCYQGQCEDPCPSGLHSCGLFENQELEGYCNIDLATHPGYCGRCDIMCSSVRGVASCNNGRCELECDAGWGDCISENNYLYKDIDGEAHSDLNGGCETHLAMDAQNCGTCGHSCTGAGNATPTCYMSQCI